MFSSEKCTSCGRCLGICDARTFSEGHLSFDREKCKACGKCVDKCFSFVNSLCGKVASVDEILEEVKKDKLFYENSGGGMTVSGGEPSMQTDGVIELIEKAKSEGISSAMETCGIGSEDFYRRARELDCLFLYDIKGIDSEKHKRFTGVGTEKIHANLEMLMKSGANIVIRMPLIPGYNDSESDLAQLRDFLARNVGRFDHAEIMPYHNLGVGKSHRLGRDTDGDVPDGRAFCEKWLEALRPSGANISVSGS